jgi:flagellar hook-basal body complex protein FliE
MNPLQQIRFPAPVEPLATPPSPPRTAKPGEASFGSLFAQAVQRVEQTHLESKEKVDRLLRGEDQELHEVVLASQRAELSFEYFLQVRNKVVQAYQEIMRMQM